MAAHNNLGWLFGPAKDLYRPDAAHDLMWPTATTLYTSLNWKAIYDRGAHKGIYDLVCLWERYIIVVAFSHIKI